MFFSDAVRETLSGYQSFAQLEHSLPTSFRSWNEFAQAEYLEAMHLLPGYILSLPKVIVWPWRTPSRADILF